MRHVLATLLLLAGCGPDDTCVDCHGELDVPPPDAPIADTPVTDAPVLDAPLLDALDAPLLDAPVSADAPDAPGATLGPVQCRASTDCPGISTCNRSAPGGVCLGCGTDADCPTGTSCGAVGACVRDCASDADCHPGMRCNGSGHCVVRDCASCPAPYVCTADLCTRPSCVDGACPAPLVCAATQCVEP